MTIREPVGGGGDPGPQHPTGNANLLRPWSRSTSQDSCETIKKPRIHESWQKLRPSRR
ncbi:MAG: hypothetical protein DVB22_002961 [Verrucomicrobia bacterium]|nr:MAG: hypothetical protein DVB22_002961 [Verrucomicrobiota bacterium]